MKFMKRSHIYKMVLGLAIAALTQTSCSDEWDDHYNGTSTDPAAGVIGATLWDAIQKDPNLSNFASVVQACGYDKSLGGSQVFTVFAPTNSCFSAEEAQKLIQAYNEEKGKVDDDENTTIKEFIQNHIALYNYSVSPSSKDTIVMMNGKYALMGADNISGSKYLTANQHYSNGVLFTVGDKIGFFSNLFEYMRKDSDLDSIRSFFYNPMFYRSEFSPSESVAGGIEDGKTVYLDSVFRLQNDLFSILDARLNAEDSTYLMVAPTNRVWKELLEEYEAYFNYDNTVNDRDSLIYTMPRLAITSGTTFSRTFNSDVSLRDSAISTLAPTSGLVRERLWGNDSLHYYEYFHPLSPNGVLTGTTDVTCSNGTMMKSDDWKFDKTNTFFQTVIIEAERAGVIREVSTYTNAKDEKEETILPRTRYVLSDNAFYKQVSNNAFVEFEPRRSTSNHTVVFNITNVLSNIGYDIYLVTAPALANDSNATAIQRLPTNLRCTLGFHDQSGAEQKEELVSSVTTQPDICDHILLAENFKFPVCTYGLYENMPQVTLTVETRVSSSQLRNNSHTRTMRIDCIILKPHQE